MLIVFTASLSYAETVGEMFSACRPIVEAPVSNRQVFLPSTLDAGLCWGAFAVVQRMTSWVDAETKKHIYGVCIPASSNRTQLIAAFVDFAKRNPQVNSEDFLDSVLAALRQSFPCPVSPPQK
jgi:hypothetical protein